MKKIFCYLSLISLLCGCVQNMRRSSGFPTPDYLENSKIVRTDSSSAETIVVMDTEEKTLASELIESVKYIPLETNSESLLGYYYNITIYKDRIYVLDRIAAEAVFIFDMEGRFKKKLGDKGGGPEEFYLLKGFSIDRRNDHLVLYDNRKRKMMYYTLDGDFITSMNVPYRFSGNFAFLPSGNMVGEFKKNDGNFHLGRFDDYRLVYSDTAGLMRKFGFKYDDNIDLSIAWSNLTLFGDEILYHPQFLSSIYTVTDTAIRQKYIIDCRHFNPFDSRRITQFTNERQFDDYWNITACLQSYIAENRDHLFFSVSNKRQSLYYFYDKSTRALKGFKQLICDREFIVLPCDFYSYGEYFVGTAPAHMLMELKAYQDSYGPGLPADINNMIGRLKEDDNNVLVLFTIKHFEK